MYDRTRKELPQGRGISRTFSSRPTANHTQRQAGAFRSGSASTRDDAVDERIVELYKQGMRVDDIIRTVGRQRHKVIHTLHKAGLHLQPVNAFISEEPEPGNVEPAGDVPGPKEDSSKALSNQPEPGPIKKSVRRTRKPNSEPGTKKSISKSEIGTRPPKMAASSKIGRWSEEIVHSVEKLAQEQLHPEKNKGEIKVMIDALNRNQPRKRNPRRSTEIGK